MSCWVGRMRAKMLRKLTTMVARLSSGRKYSMWSSSRSRLEIEGLDLLLAGRLRLLRHGERKRAAAGMLEPFVGHERDRLRQVERGKGRIDWKRDDTIGKCDLMVLEAVALASEQHRNMLACIHVRGEKGRGLIRPEHRLGLIVSARGGRQHEGAVRYRCFEAVEQASLVEHAIGAGSGAARMNIGPAVARIDQPQSSETEIGHGAGRGTDILAELRLDQHHDRTWRLDPVPGLVGAGAGHA